MIPLIGAREAANDRLVAVMRAKLEDVLAEVKTERDLVDVYTPLPERWFALVERPEEIIHSHAVAGFCYPSSTRRPIDRMSGGATTRGLWVETRYRVDIFFQFSVQDAILKDTQALTVEEILHLRADLYADAIITAVYRHGVLDTAIHDIELIFDDLNQFRLKEDAFLVGLVSTEWQVRQKITVPKFQRTPL